MRERLVGVARKLLRGIDLDVGRYDLDVGRYEYTTEAVRQRILSRCKASVVFDIGANAGQFGSRLRQAGYKGRIVSFEPLREAFGALVETAADDPLWDCENVALGAKRESRTFFEAQNSVSSSLLPMLDRHVESAEDSSYIAEHQVEVVPLDSISDRVVELADVGYLKADVQGFEHEVLSGAAGTLSTCCALEIELSIVPLYERRRSILVRRH